MGVVFQSGYSLPGGDEPLTHARILHSGIWQTGGAVSGTAAATGYAGAYADSSLTYERYKPASYPANFYYTPAAFTSCDCCCIGAHTAGSSGSTLLLRWYNGSVWTNLATVTPTDDMPIMFLFGAVTAQQWHIYMTNAACELGVVKFGKAMQMQRPLYGGHSPLQMARQFGLRSNISETGEVLGRSVQRTMLQTQLSWQHLDADWVRSTWRPFQTGAAAEPFFIAWRPETFSEVALAMIDENPVPQNMGIRDWMSVDMSVRAHSWD